MNADFQREQRFSFGHRKWCLQQDRDFSSEVLTSSTEFKAEEGLSSIHCGISPAQTRDDRPMDTDVSALQLFI